ncbi:BnaC09g52150D [Brassica napus]|uniref:BnaC09g52150D protein n=1 Tax=Brassica napus TaxID=3708 RepID=A0A078IGP2_BRANA|nr:BnaC09g52150D [Brassica napus]
MCRRSSRKLTFFIVL